MMNSALFDAFQQVNPSLASQFNPNLTVEERLMAQIEKSSPVSSDTLSLKLRIASDFQEAYTRYTEKLVRNAKQSIVGKSYKSVSFDIADLCNIYTDGTDLFETLEGLVVFAGKKVFVPVNKLDEVIATFPSWCMNFTTIPYVGTMNTTRDNLHCKLYA